MIPNLENLSSSGVFPIFIASDPDPDDDHTFFGKTENGTPP